LQMDSAWPWQPPAQVTVERSPGWYGRIAVLFGVTAALWIWATLVRAWRGDSLTILLPFGLAAVLFMVAAAMWTIRWRRHRVRQHT